jgi:hypothetical protein
MIDLYAIMAANGAKLKECKGCTEQQTRELEDKYEIKLPPIFKEYLKKFGINDGGLSHGSEATIFSLMKIRENAEKILNVGGAKYKLRNTDFVFFMHRGYAFLFLDTSLGDDSPIYMYHDAMKGEPVKISENFIDHLKDQKITV